MHERQPRPGLQRLGRSYEGMDAVGGFKRFCMVLFSIVGLLTLAALALPWFGPWTRAATGLLAIGWYYIAVEVCLAISVVGLVAVLLSALFSPKNDSVIVTALDGGQVSVSAKAITSQATHIVEADGSCRAVRVRIKARRHGRVRVFVRVQPFSTVDIPTKAARLHDDLVEGLTALCADRLGSVSLEFIEPQTPSDVTLATDESYDGCDAYSPMDEAPTSSASDEPLSPDASGDITVSMHDERSE